MINMCKTSMPQLIIEWKGGCDFSKLQLRLCATIQKCGVVIIDRCNKESSSTTHSVKISDNIASPDVYKCPITSSQRISADCTKITDNIASAEMRKHRIG